MNRRLAFWRTLFALTVHASARFPRLVPMALVEFVDGKFYGAAIRETLARVVSEAEREAQRRSWAYGQVAMHNPNVTREQVDAIADTMPAPGAGWDCLVGGPELDFAAGEEHAATVDLQPVDIWPHSDDGRKGWLA